MRSLNKDDDNQDIKREYKRITGALKGCPGDGYLGSGFIVCLK